MRNGTGHRGPASEVIRPAYGVNDDGDDDGLDDGGNGGKGAGGGDVEDNIEPEMDAEDAECGRRRVVKLQDPKKPTQAEVEEHELTHFPLRSWCKHCCGEGNGDSM